MAMGGASGRDKLQSDINVTPLVDVCLVLLIIFMVITPLLQMGYDVKVPPKATVDQPQSLVDLVIVSITPQNQIFLNKQQVTPQQLAQQNMIAAPERCHEIPSIARRCKAARGLLRRQCDLVHLCAQLHADLAKQRLHLIPPNQQT